MNHKFKTLILLALIGLSNIANSQALSYAWAKAAGSPSDDTAWGTCTDASGNVYVTGYYSASITFGTYTLTNSGITDMFIAKYDPLGNVLWAKNAGGTGNDAGTTICADASGAYVTGYFNSASIVFGTFTLTSSGAEDIFIVKYDPSGNVLWAKSSGGPNGDEGWGVTKDGLGNIYFSGRFFSPSISIGTYTLSNNGNSDMYLTKFDAAGNVIWAKSGGGISFDEAFSCAADASGNIYMTGLYDSPSMVIGTSTVTNAGNQDVFLLKYNTSGNVVWAKSIGSSAHDQGWGVTTDPSGNVYLTGTYYSSSITFGTYTLTNAGNNDVFIAKYDASGNVLWANSTGASGHDMGIGAAIDATGNVYITGRYENSITFGVFTFISAGGTDLFVVKYNAAGNVLWALSHGSVLMDNGNSIATDASGNVYTAGWFQSNITFGPFTLTNSGSNDMFLSKLSSATSGVEESLSFDQITIYPNPSSGNFTISSTSEINEIKVFNIAGEEILISEMHNGNNGIINMRSHSTGIYFVKVTDNTKKVTNLKIIIQ